MLEFERFIARRTTFGSSRSFSRIILRIAVAAVALSVGVMIVSDCIVEGFQAEIRGKVTGFAAPIVISKTATNLTYEQEPMSLHPDTLEILQNAPGITTVQRFALKPAILKTENTAEGIVIKGVGAEYDWTFLKEQLHSGEIPAFSDTATSRDILISNYMANRLELKAGDTLTAYFVQRPIRYRRYRIAGIFETNVEEVDRNFMMADLRDIQSLNRWDSATYGGIELGITDEQKLDEIAEDVRYLIPVDLTSQSVRNRFPQIFDWLGLLNVNIRIILLLMGTVAAINMVTALLIMVLERTQMTGVLKAMGAPNGKMILLFVANGLIIVLLGVLVGNVVAFGLLWLQQTFGLLQLEPSSYYVRVVPIGYNWAHILAINAGALLACTLATLLPAIIGGRVNPIRALRFE